MKSLLFVILQCYFALYPKEVSEALNFLKENEQIINKELAPLNQEERDIAMAIVAPEISQFSKVMDFVELRSLFIMYRNFGKGDFSVGYFQMKPSFIEGLEKEINNNKSFKEKYKGYLISGTDTDKRETRLKRLSSTEWQLKYLLLFIDVVKEKTKDIKFKDSEEKLRYWATLYNSGFNLSPERVKYYQGRSFFPHRSNKKMNYADIASEFYNKIKK